MENNKTLKSKIRFTNVWLFRIGKNIPRSKKFKKLRDTFQNPFKNVILFSFVDYVPVKGEIV